MKILRFVCVSLALVIVLVSCGDQAHYKSEDNSPYMSTDDVLPGFEIISQEDAKTLIDNNSDCIILDVRTQEEYDEGHIPGSICIPNETISTEPIKQLPDLNQTILVYCRSGNRSKQAARKLAEIGYNNVKEFGGIITWPYQTVKSLDDENIDEINLDDVVVHVLIGDIVLNVTLENNSSSFQLYELLVDGPLTIEMEHYGGFEVVGSIGQELTENVELITTSPGDLTLYKGSNLSIYYDQNTYELTKIGKINEDVTGSQLKNYFGDGTNIVTFFVDDQGY